MAKTGREKDRLFSAEAKARLAKNMVKRDRKHHRIKTAKDNDPSWDNAVKIYEEGER